MTKKTAVISGMLAALSMLVADAAYAGSSTGLVGVLRAHTNAPNIITFSAGTNVGKPACSVIGDEWALSLSTDGGRAMYSLLLMAKAAGLTVTVIGTSACSAWADRETPGYIEIAP